MSKFTPGGREDVVRHLVDLHGWSDRDDRGIERSKLITVDGIPIVSTDELLRIHSELAKLEEAARG